MMRWVWIVSRLVIGALFVYAGAEKMINAREFTEIVFNYQLVPSRLVNAVALFLPALELVCGLALCAGAFTRGAAVVVSALMAVFLAAIGLAVFRGLDISCGCFGGAGDAVNRATLVRDAAILAVSLVALWGAFADKRRSGDPV